MPIKPENRHHYRGEWKAIRAEILARERNACKFCGAPNGAVGIRDEDGHLWPVDSYPTCLDAETRRDRAIKIVLTIAHLDHDPTNNGEPGNRPNLAALCQRCHLAHDREHHQANARRTRRSKLRNGELFAAAGGAP